MCPLGCDVKALIIIRKSKDWADWKQAWKLHFQNHIQISRDQWGCRGCAIQCWNRNASRGRFNIQIPSYQLIGIATVEICPKTVDSPNTVLQKITGGIFCTQFVQCNDGGAGDKCMFLSVFTYSSNPLTQICEIVQLTRWAHRKFPQQFFPCRGTKNMANVYFFFLPVNSAAHNTLTSSCDCFMWLV